MKSSRLTATLSSLKEARSQMRNVADVRVMEALDNAISVLEEEIDRPTGASASVAFKALAHIGQAARYLPVLERVLEELKK